MCCAALSITSLARAETALAIEIAADAEAELDLKLVRRLIALEIADVEVPPDPTREGATDVVLFFRVLRSDDPSQPDTLSVELWELGVLHGSRRVSTGGSERLTARRVGQAAAQLVLNLRKRRLALKRRLEREALARARAASEPRPLKLGAGLSLDAAARGALVGSDGAWLSGVALEPTLRFEGGPRVGLGLGMLAGGAPSGGGWRWYEASISPGYELSATPHVSFGVGATLGAAAVQVLRATEVAGARGTTTLGARAALDLRLDLRLSPHTHLSLGPELGALLTPISYQGAAGDSGTLSGLWLGARLALRVDATPTP